jgi:hypothetical protein
MFLISMAVIESDLTPPELLSSFGFDPPFPSDLLQNTPSFRVALDADRHSAQVQVVSKEDLAKTADAVLREALKLPDAGRILTKQRLHGDFSLAWEAQAKAEAEFGWSMLSQESTVAALGAVLKRLQSGGKAKAKL